MMTEEERLKQKKDNLKVLIWFAAVPSGMALLGAFFYLPSWYYMLFKLVMFFDGFMSIMFFSSCKPEEDKVALAFPTCIVSFIALLGLLTEFVIHGGFPKSAWVILDIIYAGAKLFQFMLLKKTI